MRKFNNHSNVQNNDSMLNSASSSSDGTRPLMDHSSTPALFKVLHDSKASHSHVKNNNHFNSSSSILSNSKVASNANGFQHSMLNAIKSISNSASMIVSSMNTKTSKDAKSIINSQSTSDSISASVKNFLVKKSTSISIANSNYSHFNAVSSLNFSHSLANSSIINSTKASASNAVNSYQTENQRQSEYLQELKGSYAQLSSHFSNATNSIQMSASVSASSHVQEMINSNLTQVMSLSSNIKQINQNTYRAINQANISALDVIKSLRGFANSQTTSRLTIRRSKIAPQSSRSASSSDK